MTDKPLADHQPDVSAVIPAYGRDRALGIVLKRLAQCPVNEVLVVDNGSQLATREVAKPYGSKVRLIDPGRNIGSAARNLGARAARSELLLLLDDDSYPLPGAIETLVEALVCQPNVGVAGGLIAEVDEQGRTHAEDQVGSFDWFLRAGRRGDTPAGGFPAFFFPASGCLVRRCAFLEVGGFFEPYFHAVMEIDVATRLLAHGWDVRYEPRARFNHLKDQARRDASRTLRYRVRNQLWYFWLRFPPWMAARRMLAYLLFDLIECAYRGALASWIGGAADAWRHRALIRAEREPLPRTVLRRAELNRGRLHIRLLYEMLRIKLGLTDSRVAAASRRQGSRRPGTASARRSRG